MDLFSQWFAEARAHRQITLAEAVCLSTVDPDGYPEGRIMLLKGVGPEGFTFFTNAESNKGRSLLATPKAGLTFHWIPLGRQIRIKGDVTPTSDGVADAYFALRPKESQIGAIASKQSRVLDRRETLVDEVAKLTAQLGNGPISRPPYWKGYCLRPNQIEFWSDGAFRLHDRLVYSRQSGSWETVHLYP